MNRLTTKKTSTKKKSKKFCRIDEFDINISTNLEDFQKIIFDIKKDNL